MPHHKVVSCCWRWNLVEASWWLTKSPAHSDLSMISDCEQLSRELSRLRLDDRIPRVEAGVIENSRRRRQHVWLANDVAQKCGDRRRLRSLQSSSAMDDFLTASDRAKMRLLGYRRNVVRDGKDSEPVTPTMTAEACSANRCRISQNLPQIRNPSLT